jgi:hypothetical protein
MKPPKPLLYTIQQIYDEASREIEIRENYGDLHSSRLEDLYRQRDKAARLLSGKIQTQAEWQIEHDASRRGN